MRKNATIVGLVFLISVFLPSAPAGAQTAPAAYSAMAPLDQYLMQPEAEVALARSASPASIADKAEVMVLGREGYTTVVKGSNGFLCIVERSWGAPTDSPEFWNPKVRGPICFNAAAARSFAPIYLMKTRLVLAGKSKADIVRATELDFNRHRLPALEPGAMCFMLAKQQYLTDAGKNWHPHLMFFVAGDAAASSGANLPGSPVLATDDPEERATILMILVKRWSDGTPDLPAARGEGSGF